jgi:hypothetical protein
MRRFCFAVVLAFCAIAAYADSIPTYNLTQGSVTLTNITLGSSDDVFTFSNGQGVTIGGVDSFPPIGMSLIGGGGSGDPFLVLGFNLETANVNGAALFLFGSVNITGPTFTLPTSGTTFATTLPVLFSGSFLSCQGSFGPFGGCNPPSPNYLAQFNINGPGLLALSFTGVSLQGGGVVWQLSGATYTLTATPEPASIVLLGTGALAILGKLRRRKS